MPPVEAVASTAPAKRDDSPMLFISGMVKVPVVATLATALPLNEPVSADEITATWAGPPRRRPAAASARSLNSAVAPLTLRKAPNRINTTMAVEAVDRVMPKILAGHEQPIQQAFYREAPWPKMPMKYCPNSA